MSFLYRFLPSSKINKDVDFHYNKLDALKPLNIKNISLIAPIKKKILSLREKNSSLKIVKEKHPLSLIIPYRNREQHLKIFLPSITKYLQKQGIEYEIIIVEQKDSLPFNRAKLMNVGVLCADKKSNYFIFHDVDLLPKNIDYNYVNHTTKLFNFIDKDGKTKEYGETIFGGVTLVPKDIFYAINGFSNNYWQWGKEDDDFLMRHLFKGYVPLLDKQGHFNSLEHAPALQCDIKGNEKINKKTLTENKKLYKKNKQYFSAFKRGLLSQENDGINFMTNYLIHSTETIEKVKRVKVSFNL
jgi:hypothetical protein